MLTSTSTTPTCIFTGTLTPQPQSITAMLLRRLAGCADLLSGSGLFTPCALCSAASFTAWRVSALELFLCCGRDTIPNGWFFYWLISRPVVAQGGCWSL